MSFKPNMDLLSYWDDTVKRRTPPYIAIYHRENKTLVYMADLHSQKVSWDMVDWCFSKRFKIKPDVLLTEFENAGRKLQHGKTNTLSHAAYVAAEKDIPVVLSDLSDDEMISVLGNGANKEYLNKLFHVAPKSKGNNLEKENAKLNKYGRNPFMVANIAAALNKYDTVFCIFGEGHFREQQKVLNDMFDGEPEYIVDFPANNNTKFGKTNTGIFSRGKAILMNMLHKMRIIRLVEFNSMNGGQNDKK